MKEVLSPPRSRRLLLGAGAAVAAVAALGGWYGWLWYTTPAPPDVPTEMRDPVVAAAVRTALERVRKEGRSAAAWGGLGQLLMAHDEPTYAEPCFVQAERFDPDNPRWPYYRALTRSTTDPSGAVPFLRRAVELCDKHDRGNDAPRLSLAEALLRSDGGDEAEQLLNRVRSWDPDNPRVAYDLGKLSVQRQDDDAAERYFLACLSSPFTRKKSLVALAAICQRQGDAAGAVGYRRKVDATPDDQAWNDPYVSEYYKLQVGRRAREAQARIDMEAGRLQDALAIWRELAEDPADAHSQILAGTNLLQMGRLDEAERYFREAVHGSTEQAQSNYFLALVLCDQAAQLQKLQGNGSETARAKYQEAMACAERSLELSPDNVMTHLYYGKALTGLGRKKEGIEAYRRAVLLRPELVETHLALGKALADDDQKVKAVVELQRACDLAGAGDSRPRDLLAQVRGDKPK